LFPLKADLIVDVRDREGVAKTTPMEEQKGSLKGEEPLNDEDHQEEQNRDDEKQEYVIEDEESVEIDRVIQESNIASLYLKKF